ncbi:MAG: plastocyanin/azurin family copper-binding protein [Balneolaceae bacterium]
MINRITLLLSTILFLSAPALLFAESGTGDDVRTLEIEGHDNLRYDVEEFTAEPGEQLQIVFKTISNMPPQAMKHNIVLLKADADVDAFANASMMARDNDYIAPGMEDQMIVNTEMIGGGETSTVEFTVPETPGEYVYICTFPGHYGAGMKGVLIVK